MEASNVAVEFIVSSKRRSIETCGARAVDCPRLRVELEWFLLVIL